MRYPTKFGKYLLLDRINVGGMAEVYLAKAFGVEGFERILAIKRILPNMAEDDEFINMFVDEARIAVQLSHANIVQIYELGKFNEQYYIAMEYVSGKDLRQLLDHYRKSEMVMPLPMAAFITAKICEGLDYAHRKTDPAGKPLNLIHRDVSPQNILVSFEGDVKVTDFGIAKAEDRASKTQAGVLKGKFGYMSPEQVRGLDTDYRSDIFAVGILLYEMVTGQRLFVGESDFSTLERVRNAEVTPPTELNPAISPRLEEIMLKALAKERDERYLHASDLHDDLQQFLIEDNSIYNAKKLSFTMKEQYAEAISTAQQKMEEYMRLGVTGVASSEVEPEVTSPDDVKEKTVIFESGFGEDLSSMPTAMGNVADFALSKASLNSPSAPSEQPTTISHAESISKLQPWGNTGQSVTGMRREGTQARATGVHRKRSSKNALIIGGATVAGLLLVLLVLLLTPGQADYGTIVVESIPTQEVEIFLDDTLIAKKTPFVKADIPLGEHILVARAAGFRDKAYRFELVAGASAKINVQLETDGDSAGNGVLTIVSDPAGAEVFVQGEPKGETPLSLKELDTDATWELELRKSGFKNTSFSLRFDSDETEKTVRHNLERAAGKLIVTSKPDGANVSINDQGRGSTPLELADLTANETYRVVVQRDGFKPFSKSVRIESQDVHLRADLDAEVAKTPRRPRGPACSGSAGILSVATPGEANCTVTVGKINLGAAPFFKKPAPTGRCSISIKCTSGKQYSKVASLQAGSEEKLIVRSDMWK